MVTCSETENLRFCSAKTYIRATNILLAEKMEELNIYGEAFNFSNEVRITVLDLVNMILKQMDSELKPTILNQASHEIKNQYLSAKKAKDILGWEPQYDIEQGLSKTIDWYREYFKNNQI